MINPVTAGRLGLWLLGKRQHRAAQRRIAFPARARPPSLALQACELVAAWRQPEYPGTAVVVAAVCGVARETAAGWLRGKRLPRKHALRLADYLEARAAVMRAVAVELRNTSAVQEKALVSGKSRSRKFAA